MQNADCAPENRRPGFHYNAAVPDFSAERSLLCFLLLNLCVFGSAWFFSRRRMTGSRSQNLLDAGLLGYAVQYVSVGLPGLLGHLHPLQISITAMILCGALILASIQPPSRSLRYSEEPDHRADPIKSWPAMTIAFFAVTFVLVYAYNRAHLPVLSNDAMTYHFPAAAQWLQQGRISLLQTWFFNPANTYSPLAGSIFITWLMIPFSNDLLARFVEVPALLLVGLAMYRICRLTGEPDRPRSGSSEFSGISGAVGASEASGAGTPRLSATCIVAAVILARPIFQPSMMGKDDLFVAFFFLTALVALSTDQKGGIRLGIAVGLLLATKYTALPCALILLLGIGGQRWPLHRWISSVVIAGLLAGPWYVRNWIDTGNPLFPLQVPRLFHGLFSTAASQSFSSLNSAAKVVVGGAYGLPVALLIAVSLAWIICLPFSFKRPLQRACMAGPALGLFLFYWRSPFPEIRFLLPVFLLLFACVAVALQKIGNEKIAILIAGVLLLISLSTVFDSHLWQLTAQFAGISLLVALIVATGFCWAGQKPARWIVVATLTALPLLIFTYINWSAYSRDYFDDAAFTSQYSDLAPLWVAVNDKVPNNAVVAYTNLYLIYPMQERSQQRRLIYAPSRPGVSNISNLGWLGSNLSGERLVPAAVNATVACADEKTWLKNLRESGASYLLIGKHGPVNTPPESAFAAQSPGQFQLIFSTPTGDLYRIDWLNDVK